MKAARSLRRLATSQLCEDPRHLFADNLNTTQPRFGLRQSSAALTGERWPKPCIAFSRNKITLCKMGSFWEFLRYMTASSTPGFPKHPMFLGISVGLVLSVLDAIFCTAAEMNPGDSRALMAIVGAIFLVPASVGTVYAARSAFAGFRKFPRLRLVWVVAAAFLTFLVASKARFDWLSSQRFIHEGHSVTGMVLETHPEYHDTLIVSYIISGTDYHVRSHGPRQAKTYSPGNSIEVFYYASEPSQGFCIKPDWQPGFTVISWIFSAGVLPLWGMGLFSAIDWRKSQAPFVRNAHLN